jgi:predicted porin
MTRMTRTAAAVLAAVAALALAAPAALAKHGNDDVGVELRHGADNAKQRQEDRKAQVRQSRGADDPAGDDRGGRGHGADDGPNHT